MNVCILYHGILIQEELFTVDMQIKFDKIGNFTGVQQGDKLINVADWNKQVKSKFEKK